MSEREEIARAFIREMQRSRSADHRVVGCAFPGDPNKAGRTAWRVRVVDEVDVLPDNCNVFLAVSAMGRNARGEFRRRRENFGAGLVLMIDDVGTGPGSKFPVSVLDALPPTAMVETSPSNFQATYFFDRPVDDMATFDRLIAAFIREKFLGKDTGQAGVNRVFRPPWGINGKEKYRTEDGEPWKVRCADWAPSRRYSVNQIAEAFGLVLHSRRPYDTRKGATHSKADAIRAFIDTRAALRSCGLLTDERPDLEGWIAVRCPWIHGHSDRANTGAAIREPAPENEYAGAFRCHHGSCEGRGMRHVTEWIAEEAAEVQEMVNEAAGAVEEFEPVEAPGRDENDQHTQGDDQR